MKLTSFSQSGVTSFSHLDSGVTSFSQLDAGAQEVADQAAASARAAYSAYLRGEEKLKQAHDALMAATSAATMAQVSASTAQEAATAEVAIKQGYRNYPLVMPTPYQSSLVVDPVILGACCVVTSGFVTSPASRAEVCDRHREKKKWENKNSKSHASNADEQAVPLYVPLDRRGAVSRCQGTTANCKYPQGRNFCLAENFLFLPTIRDNLCESDELVRVADEEGGVG
ncbi:unnamed protein product [Amoebophrya sp. A25]|nr:unnamed protein product [Amoebophrya sp. A25]|eukprot:GSA25T00008423001.1